MRRPWRLKWLLREPKPNGQRAFHAEFTTEQAARHEGQRLFDTVADSVTLTNGLTLTRPNRPVKSWFRNSEAPAKKRR